MNPDLLSPLSSSGLLVSGVPENSGEVRKKFRRTSPRPIVKKEVLRSRSSRTKKSGELRPSGSGELLFLLCGASPPARHVRQELQRIGRRLENEIDSLVGLLAAAEDEQEEYRFAFWDAHERLLELHRSRARGQAISKSTLFAGYDARMRAGHAWYPHRQLAEDLKRQLNAVRDHLRRVNEEIGT